MNHAKFLIVDGSSMLVRAYFATAFGSGAVRTSDTGEPLNGVMGFLHMLTSVMNTLQPTHLFVAWDVSRDTFRRELYPAYKGTRGELPADLHPQFATTQSVLYSLAIMQHFDERFEADDIMGTLAIKAASQGHHAMVLTGDRDALQLVRANITVAIMKKGITEMQYVTPDSLLRDWQLTAEQFIDCKALMGDAGDNIPGIPGIGEKTAKKLLSEFHSLENLLANPHLLKGKLRTKIEEHRELALLCKQLATIRLDVPLLHEAESCRLAIDMQKGGDRLCELGLQRTLAQFQRFQDGASSSADTPAFG